MLANILNIYNFAKTEFEYFITDGFKIRFFIFFEFAKSYK